VTTSAQPRKEARREYIALQRRMSRTLIYRNPVHVLLLSLEKPMNEKVDATIDQSFVDAALSPKSYLRAEADPDVHPDFAQKPY
jgi:hypothetical protein